MMIARDLIISALRKGGVLTKQEMPAADELQDGLEALNNLLESWSNETSLAYLDTIKIIPVPGRLEYKIGIGEEIDTKPFLSMTSVYITQGNIDYNLESISENSFAKIPNKQAVGISKFYSYNFEYPVATLCVWPRLKAGSSMTLIGERSLPSLATIDDDLDLPPGWKRALIYNLWQDLAPEYGQVVSKDMREIARKAKSNIAKPIIRNRVLDSF